MSARLALAKALLGTEAAGGALLALVAVLAVNGLGGGQDGGWVVLVAGTALGWAVLLGLAAAALPARRGRRGALAGQLVPLAVLAVYADQPGELVAALVATGLVAQLLTTAPVRFVRDR